MDSLTANEFLQLLLKNQRRIYAFILGMVPEPSEIDDLFQETVLVMWSKFDTYETGTSFSAWGITIAKYHILSAHKKRLRSRRHFTPAVQALLMERIEPHARHLDERVDALKLCVKKLNDRDYQVVQMRYEEGGTVESIAQRMKKSIPAIYKRLSRIHEILQHCVQRTLSLEGGV